MPGVIWILSTWQNNLMTFFGKAIYQQLPQQSSTAKYGYYIAGETTSTTCPLKFIQENSN